jgi:hypothetical protein
MFGTPPICPVMTTSTVFGAFASFFAAANRFCTDVTSSTLTGGSVSRSRACWAAKSGSLAAAPTLAEAAAIRATSAIVNEGERKDAITHMAMAFQEMGKFRPAKQSNRATIFSLFFHRLPLWLPSKNNFLISEPAGQDC